MANNVEAEVESILQEAEQEQAQRQQLQEHILGSLGLSQPPTPAGSQFQQQQLTGNKTPRVVGPDQTMQDLTKAVIEGTGMAGGGLRGAAAGSRLGPYGALVGGVGGAMLGGAGSRVATTLGEEALGLHDPRTNEQRLQEALRGGVEGAAGEAGAQALIHGARAVRLGVRRLLGGEGNPEAQQLMDKAQGIGVTLRPAQVTGSATGKAVEQALRKTVAGRGVFTARDFQNEEAFTQAVQSFAEREWGQARSPQEVEGLIKRTLEGEVIPEGRLVVRGLYNHLRKMTEGQPLVDMSSPFQAVQRMKQALDPKIQPKAYALLENIERQISEAGPLTGMTVRRGEKEIEEGATALQGSVGGGMVGRPQLKITKKSEAPAQPKPLDFLDAHDIRSQLLAIGRQGEPLPDIVQARAKQAAMAIDGAMGQAALQIEHATGKPVTQAWRLADRATRDIHEFVEQNIVDRAMRDNPKGLYNVTLRKDALNDVMNLRSALQNNPQRWAEYQHGALNHILEVSRKGEYISGAEFEKQFNKVGEKVGKVVWGDQYAQLKQFAAMAKGLESRAVRETESPGLLWRDMGMIVSLPANLVSGGMSLAVGSPWPLVATGAGTVSYLIGTRQLSKMLNNPVKARQLVGAMEAQKFGKAGLTVRLLTDLMNREIGEMNQP